MNLFSRLLFPCKRECCLPEVKKTKPPVENKPFDHRYMADPTPLELKRLEKVVMELSVQLQELKDRVDKL